mgnify:CR=1 FL=1
MILEIHEITSEILNCDLSDPEIEAITFDDAEYKIVGWGDLETRFNDDRYLQNRELNERGER